MTMPSWKQQLIDGYKAFRAGDYKSQKALYEELGTKGQSPKVMLIACADSRADPSDIFNAYPGEMFVVRNVANIVPPVDDFSSYHGTASAIEFAVTILDVDVIVVMGHENCGGVQGSITGLGQDPRGGYIGRWVSIMDPVRDRVMARDLPKDQIKLEMELENVRQSLESLKSYSFVRDAMAAGQLCLQGAYFSIIKARLMMSDDQGEFHVIEDA